MKRGIGLIVMCALAALSMGGQCRQDTAQDAVGIFFTEIATVIGQAVGDALVGAGNP